jgi:hypothetical protein
MAIAPDSQRETVLPAIPEPTTENTLDVLRAIRDILIVREGEAGDPLDQVVTYRELMQRGHLQRSIITGEFVVNLPGLDGVTFLPVPSSADAPDFTPPPAPTGFAALGAIANILLDWDEPPYHNHAYTEVWRASVDDLGQAVRVGTTQSFLYADGVGVASGTRYYWIRFVSQVNVVGPFNAIAGTSATTDTVTIPDGSITTQKLADGAVTTVKLGDASVVTTKIGDSQIVTAKIGDLQITTGKIGDSAVTSPQIAAAAIVAGKIATGAIIAGDGVIANAAIGSALIIDGAIINAKIGSLAVDSAKIADASVVTAKIADLNVTTAKIADANITTAKIGNAQITTALIALLAVTTGLINDLAVTSAKIDDLAVTAAKIANATITTAKIANAQITTALIGDAQIATAKIGDLQVTNLKIGADAVTTSKVTNLSVGRTALASTATVSHDSSTTEAVKATYTDLIHVQRTTDTVVTDFRATLAVLAQASSTTVTVRLRRGTTTGGTLVCSVSFVVPGSKNGSTVKAQLTDMDVQAPATTGNLTYVLTVESSQNTTITVTKVKTRMWAKSA